MASVVLHVVGRCQISASNATIWRRCLIFLSVITLSLATVGVYDVVSFVGSISLVSVFVVTGVTCRMTVIMDVIHGIVTIAKACFWVVGILVLLLLL